MPSTSSLKLIYFSPVYWQSYEQRAHKFVRWFCRERDGRVLWVQPHPVRLPGRQDLRRKRTDFDQGTLAVDGVECLSVPALPIEPLPGVRWLNRLVYREAWNRIAEFAREPGCSIIGIGKPSALALYALRNIGHASSFYDAMDNYPDFYTGRSRSHMARVEARIASRVGDLLVSSRAIGDRLRPCRQDARLVHNACEAESVPDARRPSSRVVYGYVGSMGRWFDWELLVALAKAAPDAEFRLVGPVFERPPRVLPSNVTLLGGRPHEESLRLMAEFNVGLIPFKLNRLTAGVDPIKYYEYACAGLPVISTAFGEMRSRDVADGVFRVSIGDDLPAVLDRAAAHELGRVFVDRFRRENDWDARLRDSQLFGS